MAKNINIPIRTTGASKASSDLNKVDRSTDGLVDTVKGLGIAFIAIQSLKFFQDLAERAGRIDTVTTALDNLTGSAEGTANFVNKMGDAVKGTVSDMDLMLFASKALTLGFAKTADEAANLARGAVTMGAAVGKNAKESMQDLTSLLANQSIEVMDNMGISVDVYRRRVLELNKGNSAAASQEIKLIAIREQLATGAERQANLLDTVGAANSRLSASIKNLADSFSSEFSGSVKTGSNSLTALVNALTKITPLLASMTNILTTIGISMVAIVAIKGFKNALLLNPASAELLKNISGTMKGMIAGNFAGNLSMGFRFISNNLKGLTFWLSKTQIGIAIMATSFVAASVSLLLFRDNNKKLNNTLATTNELLSDINIKNLFALELQLLGLKKRREELLSGTGAEKFLLGGETTEQVIALDNLILKAQNFINVLRGGEPDEFSKKLVTMSADMEELTAQFRKYDIEIRNTARSLGELKEPLDEVTSGFMQTDEEFAAWLLNLRGLPPEIEPISSAMQGLTGLVGQFGDDLATATLNGSEGMKGLGDAFEATIKRMLATIAANAAILVFLNLITGGGAGFASILKASGGVGGALFGGVKFAANGMDQQVTKPTLIVAGEAGPEHVRITPQGQSQPSGRPITININGGMVDEKFVRNDLRPMLQRIDITG